MGKNDIFYIVDD